MRVESTTSVLVVDDDPLVLRALARQFCALGFDVEISADAQNAVEKLRERRPHVLVTDLVLPGEDGIVLCRVARELHPDIVVIVISGHKEVEHRIRALRAGAQDFMVKPVHFDELVVRIETHRRWRSLPLSRPAEDAAIPDQVDGVPALTFLNGHVFVRGCRVGLSRAERALLRRLVAARGAVIPRTSLFDIVDGAADKSHALDDLASGLRCKLAPEGWRVKCEKGVGYYLDLSS